MRGASVSTLGRRGTREDFLFFSVFPARFPCGRRRVIRSGWKLLLVIAVLGLPGELLAEEAGSSARTGKVETSTERRRVTGPPIAFPSQPDGLTGLDRYTADDLWNLGSLAFDLKEYEKALALFERLLERFPESDKGGEARFNAALAAERARQPARAASHYLAYLTDHPEARDGDDVRLGAARVFIFAGDPARARPLLEQALKGNHLSDPDRFEAQALTAQVDLLTGAFDRAQSTLGMLQGRYRSSRDALIYAPYHGAMVRFLLGEVARMRAEAILFDNVDDRIRAEAQLEQKARHILTAQREYLEAIRFGVQEWVGPAGYRLGELYRRFRIDVLQSPRPTTLTSAEEPAYREVLKEQTVILLLKARETYRQVLDRAAQANIRGEWVDRMRDSLKEINAQLAAEQVATDI